MLYILTVRKISNGGNSLVANLGVFNSLSQAISFVIKQTQLRGVVFSGGILRFKTPDAIDAYSFNELGDNVPLYSNDDYKVVAEKTTLY